MIAPVVAMNWTLAVPEIVLAVCAMAILIAGVSFLAQRSKRFVRFDPVLRALRERALYVFGVLATSGILAQVVKHLVGRARPRMMSTFGPYHFDLLSMGADFASFPSGHAASRCSSLPCWSRRRESWSRRTTPATSSRADCWGSRPRLPSPGSARVGRWPSTAVPARPSV